MMNAEFFLSPNPSPTGKGGRWIYGHHSAFAPEGAWARSELP